MQWLAFLTWPHILQPDIGESVSACVFKSIMTSLVLFVLSSRRLVELSLNEQQHVGGPLLHLFLKANHCGVNHRVDGGVRLLNECSAVQS